MACVWAMSAATISMSKTWHTGAIRALTADWVRHPCQRRLRLRVYEEELNVRDGFRWAPDGRSLAFWQFDVTGVENFALINNTDSLYPKIVNIPYPKAGTKNSAVRVGVIGVEGGVPRWIQVPGSPRDHYIFRVEWLENGAGLAIGQLNRQQNTATVFIADPRSGTAKAVFKDQDAAWVDVPGGGGPGRDTGGFDWLNHGKSFLWLSEREGWRHAYSISRDGGEPVRIHSARKAAGRSSAFRRSIRRATGFTTSRRPRMRRNVICIARRSIIRGRPFD